MTAPNPKHNDPGVALGETVAEHVARGGDVWVEPRTGERSAAPAPEAEEARRRAYAELPADIADVRVDADQLGDELDLTPTQIRALQRAPGFPAPVAVTSAGVPVFSLQEVWAWRHELDDAASDDGT